MRDNVASAHAGRLVVVAFMAPVGGQLGVELSVAFGRGISPGSALDISSKAASCSGAQTQHRSFAL